MFFIFTNKFFFMTQLKQWTNDAWGGFLFFFISLNEIFGFWKLKISFTEMFHESVKKTV